MKKSPVSTVLVILLSLSVLATAVLACWYVQSIRQTRRLLGLVMNANNTRNGAQSLLNEAVEYSKKNPQMEVLLKSLNQPTPAPGTGTGPVQPLPATNLAPGKTR